VQQVKPVELVYVDVTDDQGNVTKEKAVSIEYETEVPIRQSITDKAQKKPLEYEAVSVSKVVRYDDIKDQMKTIYGDPPNDAFEGLSKTSEADELGI
jgi:diphthamide biosynthesis methyltransferase